MNLYLVSYVSEKKYFMVGIFENANQANKYIQEELHLYRYSDNHVFKLPEDMNRYELLKSKFSEITTEELLKIEEKAQKDFLNSDKYREIKLKMKDLY